MKYFAKYLPVEGEIKLNDKYIYKGEILKYDKQYPLVKNTQKVKLFLCSRDNPNQAQEILTEGIQEGQDFTQKEKDFLTLGYVVEINLADSNI